MARAPPSPFSAGAVIWKASQVAPYPIISAWIFAPRFRACSISSKTRTPAPSAIINPSLSLSNGRQAFCGSSFLVLRAFIAQKPATERDVTEASEPPVSIILASPY